MLIQLKRKGKRLLSLLLVLAMLLPNFTGIASAVTDDPNAGTVCGIATHAHEDGCYLDDALICTMQEHTHTASCYPATSTYDSDDIQTYDSSSDSDDISGYTIDVQIFNNLYRTGPLGSTVDIFSKQTDTDYVFPLTSADSTFKESLRIGGDTTQENETRKPLRNPFIVRMDKLKVAKDVIITDIFPSDPRSTKVTLEVTAESAIDSKLQLCENAQVVLNLGANLTIGALVLGTDSALIINGTSDTTLNIGSISGTGSLTINGGNVISGAMNAGNLSIQNNAQVNVIGDIRVANTLTLSGATVNANNKAIVAKNIYVADRTSINGASLLGMDDTITGDAYISFVDCTFNGVNRVGAADNCTAKVRFADNCTASGDDVNYAQDYTITYMVPAGSVQDGWIQQYRVISQAPNSAGQIVAGESEVLLPEYTTPGYSYQGWLQDPEEQTAILKLTNEFGNLTLYPKNQADTINVTLDLGFVPENEYFDNDGWANAFDADGKQVFGAELDSTLTLVTPQRFGYIFKGWKLLGKDTILTDSYKIIYDELTDQAQKSLTLEAIWEVDKFPLNWHFTGEKITVEFMELSLDGGNSWLTPAKLAEDYSNFWRWDDGAKLLYAHTEAWIRYGESLDAYFYRLNSSWQTPVIRDIRAHSEDANEVAAAQAFKMWFWNDFLVPVFDSSTYSMDAENGILSGRKKEDQSWAAYSYDLKANAVRLSSVFEGADYNLIISKEALEEAQDDGWSIYENGTPVEFIPILLPDGSYKELKAVVKNGAKVTVACGNNDGLSICNWEFVAQNRQAINPVERVYDGKTKYYYDFTMPACDVNTFYQTSFGAKYVNIANGAITFVENEDPAGTGIRRAGFWHKGRLVSGTSAQYQLPLLGMTPLYYDSVKGYFYAWDNTKPLYITSDGIATPNQLTLVDSMTVYLRNCYLQALEDYSGDFVGYNHKGTFLDDSISHILNGDNSRYGNIVLDSKETSIYTTNLHFEGTNHIAAITQNNFKREKGYFSTLNFNGSAGSELYLGCAMAHANMTFTDLKIRNYLNETYPDNLKYIVINLASTNSSGSPKFTRCNIDAEDQRILSGTYSQLTFTDTVARLNSFYCYGGFNAGGTSKVHFTGDVRTGYSHNSISGSANVVVDGSFIGGLHNTTTATINTKGYVVVKGPYFDLANLTVSGGTVICNALIPNLDLTVQGGTVIANHITNRPFSGHSYDTATANLKFSHANDPAKGYQIDRGPFRVYSNQVTEPGVVNFIKGDVYLLGYHTASNGIYNDTLSATDDSNPLKNVLATVLDEDGSILENPSVDTSKLIGEDNTKQECVLLGNTNYTADSAYSRKVTITGGNIFSSGNVNFFNDVTMTSGTVKCNGAFSSSLSLSIQGGTVTAAEVGNAEALSVVENGTPRWMYTTITKQANLFVDRLGARENNAYGDAEPRTTLQIVDHTGTISPRKASHVKYLHDVSVSYVYDKSAYPLEKREFGNLRFSGSALDNLYLVDDSLNTLEQLVIAQPKQAQDADAAVWRLNSLNGKVINAVEPDGKLLRLSSNANAEVVGNANFPVEKLALYAARENANLVVKGYDYFTITEDGVDKAVSDSILLKADSKIQIKLTDTTWLYKTIVCYYDANGVLHNINPTVDAEAGTISFVMPAADVELWISDSYTLYLNEYNIVFTSTGFKAGSEEFVYRGNIVVSQSNVYATRVPMESNGYPTAISGSLQVQGKAGGSWDGVSNYDTLNTIAFTEGSGNATGEEFPRTITLEKIVQDTANYKLGTTIANGEDVTLTVRGTVMLAPIEVMRDSDFILVAETSNVTDIVCVNEAANNTQSGFDALAGTTSLSAIKEAGNITFRNLTLVMQHYTGHAGNKFIRSQSATTKCAKIENCILRTKYWGPYSGLIRRFANAEITGSTIALTTDGTYFSTPFDEVTNLVMRNTNYFTRYGGADSSATLFANAVNVTLTNCTINQETVHSTTSPRYISMTTLGKMQHIVIDGTTVMNIDHRIWINGSLTVKDSGRLNVGTQTDLGYLLCPRITVSDSAVIDSDYIIVSGFFAPKNKESEAILKPELDKKMEDLVDLLDGKNYSGLSISGNAQVIASEFVGGDVNGKITVSGGVLKSKRIGTYGALFGFTRRVPAEGEPFIYEYPEHVTSSGATVNISGGTVNVGEYLGGMNSTVNITGGKVNLMENAVLGMTDTQRDTLKAHYDAKGVDIDAQTNNINVSISGGSVEGDGGNVNVPYGALNVSGSDTGVKVKNITALYGDVTIRETRGQYPQEIQSAYVGVHVSDMLSAQNILITDQALVYAANALANAPEVGDNASLRVVDGTAPYDASHAVLYSRVYGSSGQGTVTIEGEENTNIIPEKRQYAIIYNMHDDETDRARNHAENPDSFEHSVNNEDYLVLKPATRYGFVFEGWHIEGDDGTLVKLTEIGTDPETKGQILYRRAQNDVELHAVWKTKEVEFQISVDTALPQTYVGTDTEIQSMIDKGILTKNGSVVTFKETVSVPYRSNIFGTGEKNITLADFSFPAYSILKLRLDEAGMTNELEVATSVVNRQILDAFEAKSGDDAVIQLMAVSAAKSNVKVILDLNIKNGIPKDAKFQEGSPPADITNKNQLSTMVAIGDNLGSASGFVFGEAMNVPIAPGYQFLGWTKTAEETDTDYIDRNYIVDGNNATTFYAQWKPITYNIQFSAPGGFVTKNKDAVLSGDDALVAKVDYDATIHNGIMYTDDEKQCELPYAWKPGYHFVGWSVDDRENYLEKIEKLNTSTFDMDLTADIALKLTAVFEAATITYYTNGGTFTEDWLTKTSAEVKKDSNGNVIGAVTKSNGTTVGYALPLAGNIKISADQGDTNDYQIIRKAEGEYAVLTTTADYYQQHKPNDYYEGDYRNSIGKKGYTFQGWNTNEDGTGDWYGTLPAYKDIILYAQWEENSYTLILNMGESKYSDLKGRNNSPVSGGEVKVKVGEDIDGVKNAEIAQNWPDRDEWYAIAKEGLANANQEQRFILGFTFDPLEPGAPSTIANDTVSEHAIAYRRYASYITYLINNGALLSKIETVSDTNGPQTEGSRFYLPSDESYNGTKILGTNQVPDYPDGYTIPMYAVYRERSLVFIQQYMDKNENLQVKVMESAPYSSYSDYPTRYPQTEDYSEIIQSGYSLTGWKVNAPDGSNYPQQAPTDWKSLVEDWKQTANSLGRYDINVYTAYAAQVTADIRLDAISNPKSEHATVVSYDIPGSMTADRIRYTITGDINLVNWTDLEKVRYDPEETEQIAIAMKLIDPNGVEKETIWLDKKGGSTHIAAGKGWKIQFVLYHSRVISATKDLQFMLNVGFETNTDQKIDFNTTVHLIPTQWNVKYTANLPTGDENLIIDSKAFVGSGNTRTYATQWAYGNQLLSEDAIPFVEGYLGNGSWTHADKTYGYGQSANITLMSTDDIALHTDYIKQSYSLTNSAADHGVEVTASRNSENKVFYHEKVTITPGSNNPSFIWLEYGDQRYRLDQIEDSTYPFFADKENGTYLMPAGNVEVLYDNVLELYLGYGTIEIFENDYVHHKVDGTGPVSWSGDYRILQWPDATNNESTKNVLKLSGDLGNRNIELGKLDITSENSIALAEGTTAVLHANGTITGKNILVPKDASLTMIGQNQDVTLSPSQNNAAIGGMDSCETIALQALNLTLNMPVESKASGVGYANSATGTGGSITINNCAITVIEGQSNVAMSYNGVWIGGKHVSSVSLKNTTLKNNGSSSALAMIDAIKVELSSCEIGQKGDRIANHKIRGGNIKIDNSKIYMNTNGDTLLAAENDIEVNGDAVIDITGVTPADLYRGTLQITDPGADVVICDNRFLDLSNGNLTIATTGTEQSQTSEETGTHAAAAVYHLLNTVNSDAAPDVTITGLADKAYIIAEKDCKISSLTISGDADLRPQDNLSVASVDIATGKTLIVNAAANGGMNITKLSGNGSYTQIHGTLTGADDLVVGGDMTLSDVIVNAENKRVGSSGKSGVTKVTIDNTTITAATIGAVGAQPQVSDETESKAPFVFVEVTGNSVLTGTLVQDLYRLQYVDPSNDFKMDKLPAVLRAQTKVNEETTYLPVVPANPEYRGLAADDYFGCWYILNGETKIAVSESKVDGFDQFTTLHADAIQYAKDTKDPTDPSDLGDGTKTLSLYIRAKLNGTGVIVNGRDLNKISSSAEKVQIQKGGAWTAQFSVEGAASTDAVYSFVFDHALPAGTKFTLRFGDEKPVYYYFIPNEEISEISETDFIRMGKEGEENIANLIPDESQLLEHTIQLSADFAGMTKTISNGISLVVKSQSAAHPIAKVTYTVADVAAMASCYADENNVSYSVTPNGDAHLVGKHLYLVAKLEQNGQSVSVPYEAALYWNNSAGIWLGGNMAYFALGEYAEKQASGAWYTTGLEGGVYSVKWYLTAADTNSQNILEHTLASSDPVRLNAEAREQPSLTVTLTSVDSHEPAGYVLKSGSTHAVAFTYQTNRPEVKVMLEKQGQLQIFNKVGDATTAVANGTTVVVPKEAGVYRIRFSLDGFSSSSSSWDDVYYTFIVK